MLKTNSSTPSRQKSSHPSRGELNTIKSIKRGELWNPKSLYPYWEIPKNKLLTERAKDLRKAGNLSEVIFWKTFKDKSKLGFDIDRQVIIGNYIVDFFIPELGLVFEIDGSSHNSRLEYDAERDAFMKDLNLQVVRILDLDVKKNMSSIFKLIVKTVSNRREELKISTPP